MHTILAWFVFYLCVNGFLRFMGENGPDGDRIKNWSVGYDLMFLFFGLPVLIIAKSHILDRWINSENEDKDA